MYNKLIDQIGYSNGGYYYLECKSPHGTIRVFKHDDGYQLYNLDDKREFRRTERFNKEDTLLMLRFRSVSETKILFY